MESSAPTSLPSVSLKTEFGLLSLVLGIFPWLAVLSLGIAWLFAPLFISLAYLFVFASPCPTIIAIVFGHRGRKKSQKQRQLALAGLLLGYSGAVVTLLAMVSLIIGIVAALATYG